MPRSKRAKYWQDIIIDWKSYYQAFCEKHGGDPVEYNGRLLFSDGWQYHLTDNIGPEWMPPDDPESLRNLKVAYWSIRKRICLDEFNWLKSILETYRKAQDFRSAPLQHKFIDSVTDEDGRSRRTIKTDTLDLKPYEEKLRWYKRDMAICEQHLKDMEPSNDSND